MIGASYSDNSVWSIPEISRKLVEQVVESIRVKGYPITIHTLDALSLDAADITTLRNLTRSPLTTTGAESEFCRALEMAIIRILLITDFRSLPSLYPCLDALPLLSSMRMPYRLDERGQIYPTLSLPHKQQSSSSIHVHSASSERCVDVSPEEHFPSLLYCYGVSSSVSLRDHRNQSEQAGIANEQTAIRPFNPPFDSGTEDSRSKRIKSSHGGESHAASISHVSTTSISPSSSSLTSSPVNSHSSSPQCGSTGTGPLLQTSALITQVLNKHTNEKECIEAFSLPQTARQISKEPQFLFSTKTSLGLGLDRPSHYFTTFRVHGATVPSFSLEKSSTFGSTGSEPLMVSEKDLPLLRPLTAPVSTNTNTSAASARPLILQILRTSEVGLSFQKELEEAKTYAAWELQLPVALHRHLSTLVPARREGFGDGLDDEDNTRGDDLEDVERENNEESNVKQGKRPPISGSSRPPLPTSSSTAATISRLSIEENISMVMNKAPPEAPPKKYVRPKGSLYRLLLTDGVGVCVAYERRQIPGLVPCIGGQGPVPSGASTRSRGDTEAWKKSSLNPNSFPEHLRAARGSWGTKIAISEVITSAEHIDLYPSTAFVLGASSSPFYIAANGSNVVSVANTANIINSSTSVSTPITYSWNSNLQTTHVEIHCPCPSSRQNGYESGNEKLICTSPQTRAPSTVVGLTTPRPSSPVSSGSGLGLDSGTFPSTSPQVRSTCLINPTLHASARQPLMNSTTASTISNELNTARMKMEATSLHSRSHANTSLEFSSVASMPSRSLGMSLSNLPSISIPPGPQISTGNSSISHAKSSFLPSGLQQQKREQSRVSSPMLSSITQRQENIDAANMSSPAPLLSSLSAFTSTSALTLTSISASISVSPSPSVPTSTSTSTLTSSQPLFLLPASHSYPHPHPHPHSDPITGEWDVKRAIRESHATAYNPDDDDDDEDMRLVELLRRQHFSDSTTNPMNGIETSKADDFSNDEEKSQRENGNNPYGPYCDVYGGYDASLVPSTPTSFTPGTIEECNLSIREAMRNEGLDVDACFYGTPREKVVTYFRPHGDLFIEQNPISSGSSVVLHENLQKATEGKGDGNHSHSYSHEQVDEIDLLWGGTHEQEQNLDKGVNRGTNIATKDSIERALLSSAKNTAAARIETEDNRNNVDIASKCSFVEPIFSNFHSSPSRLETPLASPSKIPDLEDSSTYGKEKDRESEKTWYSPHYLSGSAAAFTAFRRHKAENEGEKEHFLTPSIRREGMIGNIETESMASLNTSRRNDASAETMNINKDTTVSNEQSESRFISTPTLPAHPSNAKASTTLGLVHCIDLLSDDESDQNTATQVQKSINTNSSIITPNTYREVHDKTISSSISTGLCPNPTLLLRDPWARVSKSTLALASELVSQFARATTSSQLPISVSSLALLSELAARGIMEPKDQSLLSSLWPTTGVCVYASFRFVINHINRRAQTWVTIFRVKDARNDEIQSQGDDNSNPATKVRSADIIRPSLESPEMVCLRLRSIVMAVSPRIVEAAHGKATSEDLLMDGSNSTNVGLITTGSTAPTRAAVHPAFTSFIRTFNGVGQVQLPHFSKLAFSLGGLTLTQSYKHDICFTRKAVIPPGTSLISPSDAVLAQTTAALLRAYENNAIPVITKLQHCQFSPSLE